MHALDLLKNSGATPVRPVYAVFGDDSYLRRETVKGLRALVLPGEDDELSVSRFEGANAKLADLLDELRTLPFFSKRRLVILEDADTFITAHRRELEAYVDHPSETGTLI